MLVIRIGNHASLHIGQSINSRFHIAKHGHAAKSVKKTCHIRFGIRPHIQIAKRLLQTDNMRVPKRDKIPLSQQRKEIAVPVIEKRLLTHIDLQIIHNNLTRLIQRVKSLVKKRPIPIKKNRGIIHR